MPQRAWPPSKLIAKPMTSFASKNSGYFRYPHNIRRSRAGGNPATFADDTGFPPARERRNVGILIELGLGKP